MGFLKTDKVNDSRVGSTKTPFQSMEILDVASEFFHVFVFGFVLGGDLFLENIKVDLYDYLSWTMADLFINGDALQVCLYYQ